MFLHRLSKVNAPEFPRNLTWLNSKPLSMKRLSGKVVLIDFWTYSCVNCIRTFPHVKEWHDKYSEKGLVIIGVHTPEFDFEKKKINVERAVAKYEIQYPVVLDKNYKIWNLYSNRWWPRKFLIDKNGDIVYDHVGEGGYAETEQAIQKALLQIDAEELPAIRPDTSVGGGICYRTTPEIYLGFLRGKFGNSQNLVPNKESEFTDVDEHEQDIAYLHGHWKVTGDSIQHNRKLSRATEYLVLKYSAFSVNLVMGLTEKNATKSATIEVELDGHPLPDDMAGEDVVIKNGKAIATINESGMYRLVDSDTYHRGALKIKTTSDSLELFAFTFGGCKGM